MQYVKAGGYEISKFTLGTVQLGLKYGIANRSGKPDKKKSYEIISAAVNGGVNSIDTAMHYGDSETVIGDFFSNYKKRPDKLILTTKFKVGAEENLSEKDIEKQIRGYALESLRRLKIKRIPVYMLHDSKDMTRYGSAVQYILKRLRNEGIIEKAAVSVYTPAEAEEVLKYEIYEAIQIPMNVIDTRFIKSGVLKKLHAAGLIVFARSIFLQGLFFTEPAGHTGVLKEAEAPLKQFARLAESEGVSVAQFALSYIRDMEEVASLVIGSEDPRQVTDNIKLFEGPEISERARNEAYRLFNGISELILDPNNWK